MMAPPPQAAKPSVAEVFGAFLKLGLTSFGGPVAHLGYFREEFVNQRKWLSDRAYGDLVALCQFLPGPASSQVGFALGLLRAGWGGALAAFAAFTLPSALALILLALTAAKIEGPLALGALHGLKLVAVAIVAQAVWGMARALCPDRARAGIAVAAVFVLALTPGSVGMMLAILCGGVAGAVLNRGQTSSGIEFAVPVSKGTGMAALLLFAALLVILPMIAGLSQGVAMFDAFYRAGSLVFGGGHVVLPLLEAETVQAGWVTRDSFLTGYAAAQAVPGPLFTFAAWLGASMEQAPSGIQGASIALIGLFLPGFLLVIAALPFWDWFRSRRRAQSAMQGANAAVVGILGAALYDPVFTSGVQSMTDFAFSQLCFVALVIWRAPPWAVVVLGAAGGMVLAGW